MRVCYSCNNKYPHLTVTQKYCKSCKDKVSLEQRKQYNKGVYRVQKLSSLAILLSAGDYDDKKKLKQKEKFGESSDVKT